MMHAPPVDGLRIDRVPLTHPDAQALVAAVQDEYVARYGGPDETPLDPSHFEPPEGAFLVGYLDDGPAVSGAWRRHPVPEGVAGNVAVEVKRMYVDLAFRRIGLARAMLAHLEDEARHAGADTVILESGLRQPEAIALYESSGYSPIPPFGIYAGEPLCRCFAKALH